MRSLRSQVLPPCAIDEDDDVLGDDAYWTYLLAQREEALAAVRGYERALHQVALLALTDASLDVYLSARARFLATLPFTRDRLSDDRDSELSTLRSELCRQLSERGTCAVLDAVRKYRDTLERLRPASIGPCA